MKISDVPFLVQNIIIEPSNVSQQFILYGVIKDVAETQNATRDSESTTSGAKAFLTYLDFSGLHVRQCQNSDYPGTATSDFELWTPNDGRHGTSSNCFLGQQVQYIRRKQDAQCFNGEDLERVERREPCSCTEMDYVCDFNYKRATTGSQGACELIDMEDESWKKILETKK